MSPFAGSRLPDTDGIAIFALAKVEQPGGDLFAVGREGHPRSPALGTLEAARFLAGLPQQQLVLSVAPTSSQNGQLLALRRKTHLSDTRGHFQAMLLLSGRRIQYENASVALLGQRRHNRHALAVRREGDGATAVNSPPIPPRPVSGVPQIDGVINVVTSAATGENR